MQAHKVPMSQKQFRIGDLAKELKVKKFVVRFWEKEFGLKSDRSQGGQRFYTSQDLKTFLLIKDLLYRQGFTIAGAKKQLETLLQQGGAALEEVTSHVQDVAMPENSLPVEVQGAHDEDDEQPEAVEAVIEQMPQETVQAATATEMVAAQEVKEQSASEHQEAKIEVPMVEHHAAEEQVQHEQEALIIPAAVSVQGDQQEAEQVHDHLDDVIEPFVESTVRPATVDTSCSCDSVLSQLKPFKEKLLAFKTMLERS